MKQVVLITVTLALSAVVVAGLNATTHIQTSRTEMIITIHREPQWKEECSDSKDKKQICTIKSCYEKGKTCFEWEKYTEYERIIPILKEVLKSSNQTRDLKLARSPFHDLLRLKNPNEIPKLLALESAEIREHAKGNLSKLKQLYTADFNAKNNVGYKGLFGETKEGKGYSFGSFDNRRTWNWQVEQCIFIINSEKDEPKKGGRATLLLAPKFENDICYSMITKESEKDNTMPILKEALRSRKDNLEPTHILKIERLSYPDRDIPKILKMKGVVGKTPELKQMYSAVFLTKDGAYEGSFAETKEGKGYADEPFIPLMQKWMYQTGHYTEKVMAVVRKKVDEALVARTREMLSNRKHKDSVQALFVWRHYCIANRPPSKPVNGPENICYHNTINLEKRRKQYEEYVKKEKEERMKKEKEERMKKEKKE